jgi:hypothetical protein
VSPDKLESLPDAAQYLKTGVSFRALDTIALVLSDNDTARALNQARHLSFHSISKARRPIA